MELLTLVPHLLYLKNYVLLKFQFRNIAKLQFYNLFPNTVQDFGKVGCSQKVPHWAKISIINIKKAICQ